MFVILGATGQVGSVVVRNLLAAGHHVRAVVRDTKKGVALAEAGCEIALAEVHDVSALTQAFTGAEGVFILMPSNFDPTPGFPETHGLIDGIHTALCAAKPAKVVCLSTIGAQAEQDNLLQQLGAMEQALTTLPMPVTLLRAAWFIENVVWDIPAARDDGVLPTFLQPADKLFPMVATADIGRVAATLLQETWSGTRIVELEGPVKLSPNDIAACLAHLLGRQVTAQPVPRDNWEVLFRAQGMQHPTPRMQMLDGFNAGWIRFAAAPRLGQVTLELVLRELISRTNA